MLKVGELLYDFTQKKSSTACTSKLPARIYSRRKLDYFGLVELLVLEGPVVAAL